MKERPILFSAPMVRAILSGQKTQTRRAVKPQPDSRCNDVFLGADGIWRFSRPTAASPVSHAADDVRCPYGQPGDRLWVREAWSTHACFDAIPPRDLTTRSIHYQADGKIETGKYRQAFHMPHWASRILLEVTGVRVERLNDISEDDAVAEGCETVCMTPTGEDNGSAIYGPDGYAALWDQINGSGAWEANPFVWVVEFKRVTP